MLKISSPHRAAVLVACMLSASVGALAAGPGKVESLIREYSDTSRDLHKWRSTQAALLQQKASIDATAGDLAKRQTALNQQMETHNADAEQQKKLLVQSRSDCNNGGNNTSGHVNECDNNIKKLNKQTAALDSELLPLQTEQTSIDLAYAQYNQTANDWSVQEQQATTALNALYRAMNDWADQAEDLITSDTFQTEILAQHWEKYCPNRPLPSGTLNIDVVTRYADGYDKCLKYVESQRRAATHGG